MKNSKKIFNLILLFVVTIIVLYIMLKNDFNSIIGEIISINIFWLLLSLLLLLIYWSLGGYILYRITKRFRENYKYTRSLKIQILAQFLNAVTPFAMGGQPFRIYALKEDGLDYSDGTNITVQQFIIWQIALILIGIASLGYNGFFNLFPKSDILSNLVILGFSFNTFVLLFLFMLFYSKKFDKFILKIAMNVLNKLHLLKNKKEKLKKWQEHIETFNAGAKCLMKDKKEFIKLIFLTVLAIITQYMIPSIILFGMGDYKSLSLTDSIVASTYVMLIGAFIPVPGGTGGVEYSFMEFFGNFIKGSTLAALLLIWRFITYYINIIVGAILINMKGKKRNAHRNIY